MAAEYYRISIIKQSYTNWSFLTTLEQLLNAQIINTQVKSLKLIFIKWRNALTTREAFNSRVVSKSFKAWKTYIETKRTHSKLLKIQLFKHAHTLQKQTFRKWRLTINLFYKKRPYLLTPNSETTAITKYSQTLQQKSLKQWQSTFHKHNRILSLCQRAHEKKFLKMTFRILKSKYNHTQSLIRKSRIFKTQMLLRRTFYTWNELLQLIYSKREEYQREVFADTYHSTKSLQKCFLSLLSCISQRESLNHELLDQFNQFRLKHIMKKWKDQLERHRNRDVFSGISRMRYLLSESFRQWCTFYCERKNSEIVDHVIKELKFRKWKRALKKHSSLNTISVRYCRMRIIKRCFKMMQEKLKMVRFIGRLKKVFERNRVLKMRGYYLVLIDHLKSQHTLQSSCDSSKGYTLSILYN